ADDDGQARLYRTAERALAAAGYEHYEIANWAREGKRCEHNLAYWRNGQWLGVGTGSHSHLAGARSRRPASLVAYLAQIERGEPRIADPAADEASDTAMLALRLDEGLDLVRYGMRFGATADAHAGERREAHEDDRKEAHEHQAQGRAKEEGGREEAPDREEADSREEAHKRQDEDDDREEEDREEEAPLSD